MTGITLSNYNNISKKNFEKSLNLRNYKSFINRINNNETNSIYLFKHPVENYFQTNLETIKILLKNDYEGIYLSFQRPYTNLRKEFQKKQIDMEKLWIIDYITHISFDNIPNKERCIQIPKKSNIKNIIESIKKCISNLNTDKKFVFIDSLSTMTLHEKSKSSLFTELLINKIKNNNIEEIIFIFNIAEELSSNKYMKNINNYTEQHIHLGLCT